jgi:hypothetical protein
MSEHPSDAIIVEEVCAVFDLHPDLIGEVG